MSTELQVAHSNNQVMPIADVKTRVATIAAIMDSVMIKGTHYDKIPGCGDKPALLKAGAEKILSAFMLAPEFVIDDLSTDINKMYRVEARLTHQGTKTFMGSGIGECSSLESKYAWRAAVCDEEFNLTADNVKRIHFKKGWNGKPAEKINQVRQDMYSLSNTILKMAKKRALVDACMNVTACSDIFVQDLDEEHIVQAAGIPTPPPAKATTPDFTAAFAVCADLAALEVKFSSPGCQKFKEDVDMMTAYGKRKQELSK